MKHKTLTMVLALLMSMAASMASAHDFEVDGIYYNITSSKEATVAVTYQGSYYWLNHDKYTGDVVINDIVEFEGTAYSVTSIGNYAFYHCTGLTSITIPKSVTSIGGWVFQNCI